MKYSTIFREDDQLIEQAAKLHYDALSYRSFITNFGPGFLSRLYRGILEDRLGFLICAVDGNELQGFVLGCYDSTKMLSVIIKRLPYFLPRMAAIILRRPSMIRRVFQTFAYSKKSDIGILPELVVIAVQQGSRSTGIGAQLVQMLDNVFKERGIMNYKTTVHHDMEGSNRFYRMNGLVLQKSFDFYGVVWNLYVKNIR